MNAFAIALATLHADANMGIAASYRRPPFAWQDVRVIRSQASDAFGNARAGAHQVDVIASEISDIPQRGDEIRIGDTTHTVEDAEQDVMQLSWRLTLSQPAEP